MGDYIYESPKLGVPWCPGCRPEGDPTREILELSWCATHIPASTGIDDGAVQIGYIQAGTGMGEADGENCRRISELIYRGMP